MLTELDFESLLKDVSAEASVYLAGVRRQLKPIGWRDYLCYQKIWDINAHYILNGIWYGFHVMDPVMPDLSYCQRNYSSCYVKGVEEKMSNLLWSEIEAGKLSIVANLPI